MSVPTKTAAMREQIILALAYFKGDDEVYSSALKFQIERQCGEEGMYSGAWDDRSPTGKAFNRAMEQLRDEGIVVSSRVDGIMLAVHQREGEPF